MDTLHKKQVRILEKNIDICTLSYRTTNNSWRKYINNSKYKFNGGSRSTVYKLKCGSNQYTEKLLETLTPVSESIFTATARKKEDSRYANHVLQKHKLASDFKIVHVFEKGPTLNLLDTLEINKFKNVLFYKIVNNHLKHNDCSLPFLEWSNLHRFYILKPLVPNLAILFYLLHYVTTDIRE